MRMRARGLAWLNCDNCDHPLDDDHIFDVYSDGQTLACSQRCAHELRQKDRDRVVDNMIREAIDTR